MNIKDGKRSHPRFNVNTSSFFYVKNSWEKCIVYDLNLDGMGVLINKNIDPGKIIKLKISTKKEDNVFEGKIVNIRNNRYGLKLMNLNPKDIKFLKNVINHHSDRYKI